MFHSTQLTVPCHWNKEIVNQIVSIPQTEGIGVGEIYGAMANGGPVGHGRAAESVVAISLQEAIDFRTFADSQGLRFTYLLNAPFKAKSDSESRKELQRYLNWVLNELKPNAVTIASLDLMREVRHIDQNVEIHISTIAGVRYIQDLEQYLEVQPNRVVPHHDVGKDWKSL